MSDDPRKARIDCLIRYCDEELPVVERIERISLDLQVPFMNQHFEFYWRKVDDHYIIIAEGIGLSDPVAVAHDYSGAVRKAYERALELATKGLSSDRIGLIDNTPFASNNLDDVVRPK